LVAAATYLRLRLRYQLVAVATYLPKPRFSSQRPSAGSTDRYGMPIGDPIKERIVE
jgi:hypothetical protein